MKKKKVQPRGFIQKNFYAGHFERQAKELKNSRANYRLLSGLFFILLCLMMWANASLIETNEQLEKKYAMCQQSDDVIGASTERGVDELKGQSRSK